MTPHERAAYLIKEIGLKKAISHANWVVSGAKKDLTFQHWIDVVNILVRSDNNMISGLDYR